MAALSIVVGGALYLAGEHAAGSDVWGAAVAVLAAELAFEVARTVIVDHHMGVDTIALVAMVGAFALGQEFAGVIVGLMFSGGATLEDIASTRARRELTALIQRAPKVAQLRVGDQLEQVPVAQVKTGDVVVVRTGEVVPVDGTVVGAEAVVDTSTLSGEPLPVTIGPGMAVLSGSANAGSPFDVRADRPAAESAYAALVRLVEQAQAHRAPFVRMADRYAGFFLPATLIIAGARVGDQRRPCPRTGGRGGRHALPADTRGADRARVRPLARRPLRRDRQGRRRDRDARRSADRPVRQDRHAHGRNARGSRHRHVSRSPARGAARAGRLGRSDVGSRARRRARACRGRGRPRAHYPTDVREEPGQGIHGVIDGRTVAVGSRAFMRAAGIPEDEIASAAVLPGHGSGEAHVLVGVDGHVGGVIVMADELRPDADRIVERLRAEGIRHVAMVSGDRRSVAERIGRELGVDRVYAEQSPEEKLEVVRRLRDDPELRPVIMVGDGVNDAPALALADLGIAMGVAGATVSSETADAVITVDRIDRVADAVHTGRRSLHIARQSVLAGMGLSLAAMAVAAAGYLPPVAGALFQEVDRSRRHPQRPARPPRLNHGHASTGQR